MESGFDMNITNLTAMLLIGLASNLDNAGVGTAYGVRKIRISFMANTIIACIGFLLALAGGLFGDWLSQYVSPFLCNFLGMIILVAIGIWVISQSFLGEKKAERAVWRQSFRADFAESRSSGSGRFQDHQLHRIRGTRHRFIH